MKFFLKILLLSFITLTISKNAFAERTPPVEAVYNCSRDIEQTKVSDSDRDGVYDTYHVRWCNGDNAVYPIMAIGDISKWPPRGIPSRDVIQSNQSDNSFREEYYGITSFHIICWFTKYEGIDTVYYYDCVDNGAAVTDINEEFQDNFELSFSPNPAVEKINITYKVFEMTWVTLTLYNEIGVEVATIENIQRVPGNYSLSYYLNSLPSGVYFLNIKYDMDKFITRRLVILR